MMRMRLGDTGEPRPLNYHDPKKKSIECNRNLLNLLTNQFVPWTIQRSLQALYAWAS